MDDFQLRPALPVEVVVSITRGEHSEITDGAEITIEGETTVGDSTTVTMLLNVSI